MPYIKTERRHALNLSKVKPADTAGELNYQITELCLKYIGSDYSYQCLNDVIGALSAVSHEFYRRIVVPYEVEKIKENGDVF